MKHTKRGRESAKATVEPPAALEQAPHAAPAPDLKAMTLRDLRTVIDNAHKQTPPGSTERLKVYRDVLAGSFVTPTDPDEQWFLAVCQRLHREERSADTPFEEFFRDLVYMAARYAPTFEDVESSLQEFALNWRDALATARTFYLDHQQLVTERTEGQALLSQRNSDEHEVPGWLNNTPEGDPDHANRRTN